MEYRLGLSSKPGLFAVVAAFSLRIYRRFAGFVLRDLVQLVPLAVGAGAECLAGLGDVHPCAGLVRVLGEWELGMGRTAHFEGGWMLRWGCWEMK